MVRVINLFVFLMLLVGGSALPLCASTLTVEDCRKCHAAISQQVAAHGRGHRDAVSCRDCHKSHRPLVESNIPECSECHGHRPHLQITDCSACHPRKDDCGSCHQPHEPLASTTGEIALLHCRVCHSEAYELLQRSTSKHRELSCSYCHAKHRQVPDCSECHGLPHTEGTHDMFPQCMICHSLAHDLSEQLKK